MTTQRFKTYETEKGTIHVITKGLPERKRWRAVAIRFHPFIDGAYTVDLLPWLCPWECAVDGPFKDLKDAKKAALGFIAEAHANATR